MLPSQLCDTCKALDIDETLQELAQAIEKSQTTQPANSEPQEQCRIQSWYRDLSSISNSVFSTPCQLCKLVLEGLRADRAQLVKDTRQSGDWPEPPRDFYDDILKIRWYSNIRFEIVARPLSDFEWRNTRPSGDGKLNLNAVVRVICNGGDQAHSSWDGYGEIKAELRISCKNGQIQELVEIDQTVGSDPQSENVLNHLRFWLSMCSTEHKGCHRTSGMLALPTRVLDIGASESGIVYLREQDVAPRVAPYAALSHCWGLSQPFTTITANFQLRKDGIRIAELPQSFRDAITMTKALGIQYLWIDSLCIIQDDIGDWQRESASMMMVYRGAHVVIGASSASADSEGFLHRRSTDTGSFSQAKFTLRLLPPEPQRLSPTSDPVKDEPLSTRAWCLQERYIPHRVLLVSKGQMYWECFNMLASEDGDCIAQNGGRLRQIKETAGIDLSITGISGRGLDEINKANYFHWYETVKAYAKRDVTKESDRLPALAGLAFVVSPDHKDYMAGIWKKGLIEGLLWCRADQERPLSTPAEYRAPSWSWASVEGPINFPVYNFYDRCKWKWVMANFEPLATYIHSLLEPSGEDFFGGVKDGYLTLRGPLLPLLSITHFSKISYTPSDFIMEPFRSTACDQVLETELKHNGKTETIYLDGGFDTEERREAQGKLFIFLLARLPDTQSASGVYMDIRFGLILEALAPGRYKRVGIIDGVVKTHKPTLRSRLTHKVHLENYLWKQHELKGEDEVSPNLQGPDPFAGLEQTIVTII